jgi:hypothetical protein
MNCDLYVFCYSYRAYSYNQYVNQHTHLLKHIQKLLDAFY